MATEGQIDPSAQKRSAPMSLPDTAAEITVTLSVATEDDATGQMVLNGFQYLLALEFARQQPALSLLYELNFKVTATYAGSQNFDIEILVKLRKRVTAEISKAGAVGILFHTLAIPIAIHDSIVLWERLFPPVKVELNAKCSEAPAEFRDLLIRAPVVQEPPLLEKAPSGRVVGGKKVF